MAAHPPDETDSADPDRAGETFAPLEETQAVPASDGQSSPGRYTEERLVGQGSIGRVHAVLDRRIGRLVARKQLQSSSRLSAAARFVREAVVTAHLEHPGIVPVYDAGLDEAGRPYYTMRLIRGESLAQRISRAASLSDRLALIQPFLAACQAVAYAHSHGTVHRDLKPENVMLGQFGEAQVVDWGLARADWADGEPIGLLMRRVGSVRTLAGAVVGTPAFMSPEQANGRAADARSDVWSLGGILFEILTGRPPFVGATGEEVLAQARRGLVRPVCEFDRAVPPDLGAIADRALASDPEARYANAGELAADLERWGLGRQVDAYRYTPLEIARRFVGQNRTAMIAVVAAALLASATASAAWLRTTRERDRAVAAEATARAALDASDATLARSLVQEAATAAGHAMRAEAEILASRALAIREDPEARGILAALGAAPRARRTARAAIPPCAPGRLGGGGESVACVNAGGLSLLDGRTGETRWHRDLPVVDAQPLPEHGVVLAGAASARLWVLDAATGASRAVVETRWPEGRWKETRAGLIVGSRGPDVFLADLGGAEPSVTRLQPCGSGRVASAAPRRDGSLAVLCADGRFLDVPSPGPGGKRVGLLAQTAHISGSGEWRDAAVHPTEDRLAVVSGDSAVAVLDLATGATSRQGESSLGRVHELDWSPDGALLAARDDRGEVVVMRGDSVAVVTRLPTRRASGLAWAGNSTLLVAESEQISTWEVPSAPIPVFGEREGLTTSLAGPDHMLVTAHGDGRIVQWDTSTGARRREFEITPAGAKALDWAGGDLLVVAAAEPRLLRIPATGPTAFLAGPDPRGAFRRLVTRADGTALAASYRSGLYAWNLATGESSRVWPAVTGEVADLARSGDGRVIAFTVDEEAVWVAPGPELPRPVVWARDVGALALDSRGALLAVARGENIELIDAASGEVRRTIATGGAQTLDLAFSPDGNWLAAGDFDRAARVWDVGTGRLLATLRLHRERVSAVTWSGQVLYTGSWDHTARGWDLAGIATQRELLLAPALADWGITVEEAIAARAE